MKENRRVTPEEFAHKFLDGDFLSIYSQTTEEFKQEVSFEQLKELGESFNSGVDCFSLEMKTNLNRDLTQYLWLDSSRDKAMVVFFAPDNVIHGIRLAPFISYPESDRQFSRNAYIMPIKEEWFVFWGGTNQFINYHYPYENQRYAYDLVIMKDGLSYHDSRNNLSNYYAFNKEITAPAHGKIVKIVDGMKDNAIGELNSEYPEGNCVIMEHRNNEFSMLAHLKQDSIVVKEGDSITKGQLIALCGNSGNSTEPHLHFQVMNSSNYREGSSIRIRFEKGLDPIQGDFISPAVFS
ncbi:M23 family metallopeptidase [Paenibacillus alvei]